MPHGRYILCLQPVLGTLTFDQSRWREIVSRKKDGKQGRRCVSAIIGWPQHIGIGVSQFLMGDRSARGVKQGKIHPQLIQRPGWSPIPPGPPGPDILVGIHEYGNAVLLRFFENFAYIRQVCFVVDPGSAVLKGLPGNNETEKGETPGQKPVKMLVRLLEWKRPPHKGDDGARIQSFRISA